MKFKIRLPEYSYPRNRWRKNVYNSVQKKLHACGVTKMKYERIELKLVLYFDKTKIKFVDVDNRLKDVMDALQARWGSKITKKKFNPLIENDNSIYKVTVEKRIPPIQSKGLGHLLIKKMK